MVKLLSKNFQYYYHASFNSFAGLLCFFLYFWSIMIALMLTFSNEGRFESSISAFWSQGEFVSCQVNVTYTGNYVVALTDNTGATSISSNLKNLKPERTDIVTIELASTSTYIDLETDLGSVATSASFVGLTLYPIFSVISDDYITLNLQDYLAFSATKPSGSFANNYFEGRRGLN